MAVALDREPRDFMAGREGYVEQLLRDYRAVMEKVAAALLEKEALDEKEFAALVAALAA